LELVLPVRTKAFPDRPGVGRKPAFSFAQVQMDTHGVTEFCLVDTSRWPRQVGTDGKDVANPQPRSTAFLERAMVQTVIPAADRVARKPEASGVLRERRRAVYPRRREERTTGSGPGLSVLMLVALVAHSVIEWWSPQFFRLPQRPVRGDTKIWI
jgi:hypothetical protein